MEQQSFSIHAAAVAAIFFSILWLLRALLFNPRLFIAYTRGWIDGSSERSKTELLLRVQGPGVANQITKLLPSAQAKPV